MVFTDVWASMGQEERRPSGRRPLPAMINRELMAETNPGCMVQHCLPAHRGGDHRDVFEEHAEEIFDEAENRLHAQKAVIPADGRRGIKQRAAARTGPPRFMSASASRPLFTAGERVVR